MSFSAQDRSQIQKILILRWGSMGDLVICSAIIEDIRNAFPNAELCLNVEPPWQQLYQADQRFSKVITQKIRKTSRWQSTNAFLSMLRQERFDLIIDLQTNDRSRLLLTLALLSGCAPRHRVSTQARFPYNISPESFPRDSHALTYLRAPLKAMGIPCETDRPCLELPEALRTETDARLDQLGLTQGGFSILVPGSSQAGATKRWGVDNYVALGKLMVEQQQRVVILGGPDEIEICQQVQQGIGEACLNLCGQTKLLEIIPIAERAHGVVSNDTGVAHLIAAANVPMVVICGPTLAKRVKPIGPRVAALQIDPACFQTESAELCMARITPAQVMESLATL